MTSSRHDRRLSTSICSASSLGALQSPPRGVLYEVFGYLKFQTLPRFSKKSHAGVCFVQDFPSYSEMMKHAPEVLSALGKTRIISHHPTALLHRVLHTTECVSCGRSGGFLLRLTCERICLQCQRDYCQFRLIPASVERGCFCFGARDMERLPIAHLHPKYYRFRSENGPGSHPWRLVNFEQAKQLADRIWQDWGPYPVSNRFGLSAQKVEKYNPLQRVHIGSPSLDLSS